jgi:DNA-directed RNA polymerase specialized sigma24 family protein
LWTDADQLFDSDGRDSQFAVSQDPASPGLAPPGRPAARFLPRPCEAAMRISQIASRKAQLLLLQAAAPAPAEELPALDPQPEMVCFRGQALAIVRHFFEISSQFGRLPSLLGREFFRARVSHHSIPSFEEQIVFICDVELCLGRLSRLHAEVITLAGLYHFSHEEVADMLHCSRTLIDNYFTDALDTLSEHFLRAALLRSDRPDRRQHQLASRNLSTEVAAPGKKPPRSVTVVPESSRGQPPGSRATSLTVAPLKAQPA